MSFIAAAIAGGHPTVAPGVLGFLVVAGIGLALVFLLRSMNKQFKKLGPPPGEPGAPGAKPEPGARPGEGAKPGESGAKPGDKAEDAAKRE